MITLGYLERQALEHPKIGRKGFLTRSEVAILTGRKPETLRKDEQHGLLSRNDPDGAPVYDITHVHAYLTKIGYTG